MNGFVPFSCTRNNWTLYQKHVQYQIESLMLKMNYVKNNHPEGHKQLWWHKKHNLVYADKISTNNYEYLQKTSYCLSDLSS